MSLARTLAYYVYILASEKNGTLYIGVTNDLIRRVYEHREAVADGAASQAVTPALRRARDCLQSRSASLGSRGPAASSDRAYSWTLGSRLLRGSPKGDS